MMWPRMSKLTPTAATTSLYVASFLNLLFQSLVVCPSMDQHVDTHGSHLI